MSVVRKERPIGTSEGEGGDEGCLCRGTFSLA